MSIKQELRKSLLPKLEKIYDKYKNEEKIKLGDDEITGEEYCSLWEMGLSDRIQRASDYGSDDTYYKTSTENLAHMIKALEVENRVAEIPDKDFQIHVKEIIMSSKAGVKQELRKSLLPKLEKIYEEYKNEKEIHVNIDGITVNQYSGIKMLGLTDKITLIGEPARTVIWESDGEWIGASHYKTSSENLYYVIKALEIENSDYGSCDTHYKTSTENLAHVTKALEIENRAAEKENMDNLSSTSIKQDLRNSLLPKLEKFYEEHRHEKEIELSNYEMTVDQYCGLKFLGLSDRVNLRFRRSDHRKDTSYYKTSLENLAYIIETLKSPDKDFQKDRIAEMKTLASIRNGRKATDGSWINLQLDQVRTQRELEEDVKRYGNGGVTLRIFDEITQAEDLNLHVLADAMSTQLGDFRRKVLKNNKNEKLECVNRTDRVEYQDILKDIAPQGTSASEALFGFCGWLTTREKTLSMSAYHVAGPVVEAISLFCKFNNLPEPRPHWEKNLNHPTKEKEETKKVVEARAVEEMVGTFPLSLNNLGTFCSETTNLKSVAQEAYTLLSGSLSYDNVAEAKKVLKTILEN